MAAVTVLSAVWNQIEKKNKQKKQKKGEGEETDLNNSQTVKSVLMLFWTFYNLCVWIL